jgi:endonuclease/exonuclease/phosphatase family metal-dependent hydrolase
MVQAVPSETATIELHVVCWNLHGLPWPISKDPGGRIDRAGARIREASPDVVLLQEIWRGWQVERLARALPGWTPFCVRPSMGAPRGGLLGFLRAGGGWAQSAPPQFHQFTASAPVWKVWEGDGFGGKGILILEVQRGAQRAFVLNTHLQSQYPSSDYVQVRESQLRELQELVLKLTREEAIAQPEQTVPIVIAGDFNTDSSEPLYSYIAGLGIDLTAGVRRESGCGTNLDLKDGKPQWIDYVVLANSGTGIVSAELTLAANVAADDPYSDHSGLFCTIALAPRT